MTFKSVQKEYYITLFVCSHLIKDLDHAHAVTYQHCEGVKEQHQSGNTRLDAQVAFVDDDSQKHLNYWTERLPKGSNNILQAETSAVLAIATKIGNASPSGCAESVRIICSSAQSA